MEMGTGYPERFVSTLRMENAALSRHEQSLVMAICRRSLRFEDASANMRRLFGSRGGGSRQDDLFSGEAAEPRASDGHLDVLAAYRKAKKQGAGRKKGGGPPERGGGEVKWGGQTLNGFNRKTGQRNRRYRRDSEHHLAPRCPWRDTPPGDGSLFAQERNRSYRPPYPSAPTETPV